MAPIKILLTGSTGMIGYDIVRVLLGTPEYSSASIRIAVRNPTKMAELLALPPTAAHKSRVEVVEVADITVPGAYDAAVQDVTHIIHTGTPRGEFDWPVDVLDDKLIQPSIRSTLSLLAAAKMQPSMQRVVLTSSVAAFVDTTRQDYVLDETIEPPVPQPPYASAFPAYLSAKMQAHRKAWEFIKTESPRFDLVALCPSFVVGADQRITNPGDIVSDTNALVMAPLLGVVIPQPLGTGCILLEDNSEIHVKSLDKTAVAPGDYILNAENSVNLDWGTCFDIAREHFPRAVESGLLSLKDEARHGRAPGSSYICSDKAEKTFGKPKSYEVIVKNLVQHYLNLAAQASEKSA